MKVLVICRSDEFPRAWWNDYVHEVIEADPMTPENLHKHGLHEDCMKTEPDGGYVVTILDKSKYSHINGNSITGILPAKHAQEMK